MNRPEAEKLIEKYNKGIASPDEKKLLDNWYLQQSGYYDLSEEDGSFLFLKSEIWKGTLQRSGLDAGPGQARLNLWPKIAAAVVVLITLSIGLYFYSVKKDILPGSVKYANDAAPGGNKAILTLANGEKIILTDANNGRLAEQNGIKVTKSADGQLVYEISNTGASSNAATLFNTIETPKGGQYQVLLPDGSKVWINAGSSLKYPLSFTSTTERQVELKGEAYFEVAKNKEKPFRVITNDQIVEVLGTHFNINCYPDEPGTKTTLLEGSVKVESLKLQGSVVLKPGQQAVLTDQEINVKPTDAENAIAWKNGLFSFNNDDLKTIMRQVARWYDLDVVYEGNIPDEKYFGDISRNSNLSEVFKILELNNAHFKIDGKTIKVSYNQENH